MNRGRFVCLNICRFYCKRVNIGDTEIDWDYFSRAANAHEIVHNAKLRDLTFSVSDILQDALKLNEGSQETNPDKKVDLKDLKRKLSDRLKWFPNKTHPRVLENALQEPLVLEVVRSKPSFSYHPASFDSLSKRLNLIRTKCLGHMTGDKSYYLRKDLAELERALTRYTLGKLIRRGFTIITVPDILPKAVLEACGMKTTGKHSQVYHIDEEWAKDLCLSGTAEMGIASNFINRIIPFEELPIRLCAVSRCFRAEAGSTMKENGIFRVHQFTKVEMFGITSNEHGNESELLLDEFVQIQKDIFYDLGLHFKILEMPPCDLGLPAYHKIDMEVWMPGRKLYGEISSASNCIDYQSRRLHTSYLMSNGISDSRKHCHTVNGTACAIPRMLIAIFENFQNLDGSINIPRPLQQYFGKEIINTSFSEGARYTKITV